MTPREQSTLRASDTCSGHVGPGRSTSGSAFRLVLNSAEHQPSIMEYS